MRHAAGQAVAIAATALLIACSSDQDNHGPGDHADFDACSLADPEAFEIAGVAVSDPASLSRLPSGAPLPTRDPRVEAIHTCGIGSSSALTVYDVASRADARSVAREIGRYAAAEFRDGDVVELPAGRTGASKAQPGAGFVVWQYKDLTILVTIVNPVGAEQSLVADALLTAVRNVEERLDSR